MSESYSDWIRNVDATLRSINMSLEEWQRLWPFNFQQEFNAGVKPDDAAMKANRYWWFRQNKSLNRQCEKTPNCWLPRGHQGLCELASVPMYEPGNFVKVEFPH